MVRDKDRALADQRIAWEDDSNGRKKEVAESSAEVEGLTQELARAMKRNEEVEERLAKRKERISLTLGTEAYESILESTEAHRGSQGGGREEAEAVLWKEVADPGGRVEFEELQTDASRKDNDLEILKKELSDRGKEVWILVKELQGKVSYSRLFACLFPVSSKFLMLKKLPLLWYDIVAGQAS